MSLKLKIVSCDGKSCGLGRHIRAGKYLCPHNNLLALHPDLCQEWNYEENEKGPQEYLPGTSTKVSWICKNNWCGCHKWTATVLSRVYGCGCPYCSSGGGAHKKICPHNNLLALYPEVCAEWDYELNDKSPAEYSTHSEQKVSWVCKSENNWCGCHKWRATVAHRVEGRGCPYCCNAGAKKLCPHNNLAYLFPSIASEWDYNKNTSRPEDYAPGTQTSVWWICSKNTSHRWKSVISSRTRENGHNCPHCAICRGYSKAQIEWLESIMKEQNIQIQYASSPEGEFKINGVGEVDGYHNESNTVYEYHGDYWHGNPLVYNLEDKNQTNGKIFGQLYQKTIERDNKIRELGYNLIVKWETEEDIEENPT